MCGINVDGDCRILDLLTAVSGTVRERDQHAVSGFSDPSLVLSHCFFLVALHSDFDRLSPAEHGQCLRACGGMSSSMLRANPGVRLMEPGALEGEDHLVHRGSGDGKEALQVGFGRSTPSDLVGKAGDVRCGHLAGDSTSNSTSGMASLRYR